MRWIEGTKRLDQSGTMHAIRTEQNGMFEIKCRRKIRNGGLESRMQERDQSRSWKARQKARVRSLITEIAMLAMMLIRLIDIRALLVNGFVANKGLGIHIERGQVVKFGKVERRADDVRFETSTKESKAGNDVIERAPAI